MKKLKLRKRGRTDTAIRNGQAPKQDYAVLIGTPVPMIDHKIMSSLSNFVTGAAARKIALPHTIDSRNPENGRNSIIFDFLTRPELQIHTHLMFLDADTIPNNSFAIEEMMKLDKPVVSGITPIFTRRGGEPAMYWNVRGDNDRNMFLHEMPAKPFKADYVGGSCLLIKREVLETLEAPYMKPEYDPEYMNFKKGEDYFFCDKIRKAGFDIWVDPEIQCHHFHLMNMFDIIEMLARYAKQTEENPIKEAV